MHGDRYHHEVADVGFPITTLIGEPVDQTALVGVINHLNDLELVLVSAKELLEE